MSGDYGTESVHELISSKYFPEDEGQLERTMARVRAKVLVMPCSTDQYFPPQDSEVEVRCLGEKGRLRVVEYGRE